ncbi:MAG TPA: hypothetical protein VFD64_04030 [Gemmatimonadaceae bacterium]|nr:hypothetical protein [Gemmatimonadaceae bacterium]
MKTRDGVVQLCALWIAGCTGQGEPLLASSARAAESVVFASDLWPGEGIPVIEMRRPALPVYSEPDPTSSVVDTLRGRVGQRVAFDSTRYQTIESGTIRTHSSLELKGRDLGHVQHLTLDRYYRPNEAEISIPLAASSTVEFLQYRAEGTCFVRVQNSVIDAQPCPGFGRESVSVVRDPVTRWWVLVRGVKDKPGWLLVSDSTAKSVRREF